MFNALREWRKELNFQSSDLNPKKWCKREDIERVEKVLLNYFGETFFTKPIKGNNIHIVHSLLMQYNKQALTSLFEIVHLLEYLGLLSTEIQRKFKSHCKKPRQFQDSLFEIYTYRILDGNRIRNQKATHRGKQELEGECVLNSKKIIFECRKSYSVWNRKWKDQEDMRDILMTHLSKFKRGYDFIGRVSIKKYCGAAKEDLNNILKLYFTKECIRSEIEFDFIHFETKLYNEANLIEYNSRENTDVIKFKLCYKDRIIGLYNLEFLHGVSSPQSETNTKIIKTIDKKRNQHKNSKFENRIIFIDCEVQSHNKFPLMMDETMLEPAIIDDHLKSKDTNDIVVIFMRDYSRDKPVKKTFVFGKDKFEAEKRILKRLKPHFASVYNRNGIVSYRSPFKNRISKVSKYKSLFAKIN